MKESLYDYMKRGGLVTKIEYITPPAEKHVMQVKPNVTELVDLAGGSLFYTENVLKPKSNRVKSKGRKPVIDVALLPSSLLPLLKSLERSKNEE